MMKKSPHEINPLEEIEKALNPGEEVIDEHPLDWRRKHPSHLDIVFFCEISKEEYERNEGSF
jgi:hypothetical protein